MTPEAVKKRIQAISKLELNNYSVFLDNGHIYNNDSVSVLYWNHDDECFEFFRTTEVTDMAALPYEFGSVEYDHIEDIRVKGSLEEGIAFIKEVNPGKAEFLEKMKEYFAAKMKTSITGSTGDGVKWNGNVGNGRNGGDFYAGGSILGGRVPNLEKTEEPKTAEENEASKEETVNKE